MNAFRVLQKKIESAYNRIEARIIILLYHRICDAPTRTAVAPENFSQQLEYLGRNDLVISLERLVAGLRTGNLPRKAVVITFDDGYADNLKAGLPLLEEYECPATVFVSSQFVGDKKGFWWDRLRQFGAGIGGCPADMEPSAGLKRSIFSVITRSVGERMPVEKDEVQRRLQESVVPLPRLEREELFREIEARFGIDCCCAEDDQPLSSEELSRMAESGLIEIGSHTRSHTALTALSEKEQVAEIYGSKSDLEAIIGAPVKSFSYPFGFPESDYPVDSIDIVRQGGYELACSAFPGAVGRRSDMFQLPRCWVNDWSGDEFARRLGKWFLYS